MLLDFIGETEAPGGYGVIYRNRQNLLPVPLTEMTLGEVLAAQPQWKAANGSSAAGRYQVIDKTLLGLAAELGLDPGLRFDAQLQDRLGQGRDLRGDATPTLQCRGGQQAQIIARKRHGEVRADQHRLTRRQKRWRTGANRVLGQADRPERPAKLGLEGDDRHQPVIAGQDQIAGLKVAHWQPPHGGLHRGRGIEPGCQNDALGTVSERKFVASHDGVLF